MPITCDITIDASEWNTVSGSLESILRTACARTIAITPLLTPARTIEISLLLTNDASITRLNAQYLGKHKPTNVLSFPSEVLTPPHYPDLPDILVLGDIVLAYETILREAEEQQKTFLNHMTHLTIHGMLHLLGYDHEATEDALIMEGLEVQILQTFNIQSPYTEPTA